MEMQAEQPRMTKSSTEEEGKVDLCRRRSFRDQLGTLERLNFEEIFCEIEGQRRNKSELDIYNTYQDVISSVSPVSSRSEQLCSLWASLFLMIFMYVCNFQISPVCKSVQT